MATLFTRIVNGEIPCYKVAENDKYLAFLDINPLAEGHTLVISKKEVDYIFDLDDELFSGLHLFAKKVAKAIDKSVRCSRIGVAVIGLEVPHAHIHLVPLKNIGDLNFANPKLKFTPDEFKAIATKIASNL
jgi:histidine triad (HIT) family protein